MTTTKQNSPLSEMPLWKWIIELAAGLLLFILLYGIAQGFFIVESKCIKISLFLVSSIGILWLYLLWSRLFEKRKPQDLLFKNIFKNLGLGLFIGFAFFCIITAILFLTGNYKAEYAFPDWEHIIVCLAFFFLVACSEEVLFRGILFRMIDERYGIWWAFAVSALVFGFVHIIEPNATLFSSIAIAIEAGLLLAAVYKYSGSLWLPIGIHWAWNFSEGNIFCFPVSGEGEMESILKAVVSGNDLLTGGAFGPEASIHAIILGLALSAFFIKQIKR